MAAQFGALIDAETRNWGRSIRDGELKRMSLIISSRQPRTRFAFFASADRCTRIMTLLASMRLRCNQPLADFARLDRHVSVRVEESSLAWNPMCQHIAPGWLSSPEQMLARRRDLRLAFMRIVGMKCERRTIHWNPFPGIGPLAAIFWDDLCLQRA
jgi:hypothetical protein